MVQVGDAAKLLLEMIKKNNNSQTTTQNEDRDKNTTAQHKI
jgi:hypothetical protein